MYNCEINKKTYLYVKAIPGILKDMSLFIGGVGMITIRKFNNENGFSMPLVMMAMVVVILLATTMYDFSRNRALLVEKDEDAKQARYLANSGVSAAIDWWKKNKPTEDKTFDTVYLNKEGNYVLNPVADGIGVVNVSIDKGDEGRWTITGTAEVNEVTQKVEASSTSIYKDADLNSASTFDDPNPKWYRWIMSGSTPQSAEIQRGTMVQEVEVGDDTKNAYIHTEVEGVAVIGRSDSDYAGKPIRLIDNDADCRVGYIAKALFFQNPLNLDLSLYNTGFLAVAAEKVVFNRYVSIWYHEGWISYGAGVLVLAVPDGLGIPGQEVKPASGFEDKVQSDEKYGLVFFNEVNVGTQQLFGKDWRRSNDLSNKAFYFLKREDGVVMFESSDYSNEFDNMIEEGHLIPAGSSVAIPDPEDEVDFFYN